MPVHAIALRDGMSVDILSPELRERLDRFVAILDEKLIQHTFEPVPILCVYAASNDYQEWMFPILKSMYEKQGWELRRIACGKHRFDIARAGSMEAEEKRYKIFQQQNRFRTIRNQVICTVVVILVILMGVFSVTLFVTEVAGAVKSTFQELVRKNR